MRVITPRVFVRDTCRLGEGPFWLEDRLWWVDIDAGKLYAVDAAGENRIAHDLGQRIGAAAPAGEDEFIVALEAGIGWFHAASGEVEILASPERNVLGNRFNDGKCDPAGRFVAGTMNMQGKHGTGALYAFERKQGARKILDSVSLSNGLAWSADGATLYYVDTPTREIASFSYDLETARLGDRKIVASIPPEMGFPDGMDIDIDGNLWVAHWEGYVVRCWSPVTGQCLAEVRLPCSCPTSCCFGGVDLDRLFITSANGGTLNDESQAHSLAGSIFVCEPGVVGLPVKRFCV